MAGGGQARVQQAARVAATKDALYQRKLTELEIASQSVWLQKAMGNDKAFLAYLNSYNAVLMGEKEYYMPPQMVQDMPDVFAFSASIESYVEYRDIQDERKAVYSEIMSLPGADEQLKAYMALLLPEGQEAEKEKILKSWLALENPEEVIPEFSIREISNLVLDSFGKLETPEEEAKITPKEYKKVVLEDVHGMRGQYGQRLTERVLPEELFPEKEGEGISYGLRESRAAMFAPEKVEMEKVGIKDINVSEVIRLRKLFNVTTNALDNAYKNVYAGIDVVRSSLSGLSDKDYRNIYEGGVKGQVDPLTGIFTAVHEADVDMGYMADARRELKDKLEETVSNGVTTGFVTLSTPTIAKFFTLTNQYSVTSRVLNTTRQLDLIRNIPRENNLSLINDMVAYVSGQGAETRTNALSRDATEKGINLADVLDETFAERAMEAYKRQKEPTALQQRLGTTQQGLPYTQPGYRHEQYSWEQFFPTFKRNVEKVMFEESTFVGNRAVQFGETQFPSPDFYTQANLPQRDYTKSNESRMGFTNAIEFYFPSPTGTSGDKQPTAEEYTFPWDEEEEKRRRSGFPITRYDRPRY